MRTSPRFAAVLAATALIAMAAPLAVAPIAYAQSAGAKAAVDRAKASGVVGEQADGFLGFVAGGGVPTLHSAVAEINAGRAAAYRQAAARTGVSAETAGQATARQLESQMPSGQFFRSTGGQWERR